MWRTQAVGAGGCCGGWGAFACVGMRGRQDAFCVGGGSGRFIAGRVICCRRSRACFCGIRPVLRPDVFNGDKLRFSGFCGKRFGMRRGGLIRCATRSRVSDACIRCVCTCAFRCRRMLSAEPVVASFGRLRTALVEMFHRDEPSVARPFEYRNDAVASRAGAQVCAGRFGVADGGGKSDAAWIHVRHAREPLDAAKRLVATIAAQQGMHLVDDDIAQIAEQPVYRGMPMEQHRFERFRRDLQNARRVFHQAALVRLRDVAMPAPHGNARFFAERIESQKLVVDQRFQRPNVDAAHGGGRVFPEFREDGEEGRLGFARRGGRRQQHIVVGVENGVGGRDLHRAQTFPSMLVDEILDEGRVSLEGSHDNRRAN